MIVTDVLAEDTLKILCEVFRDMMEESKAEKQVEPSENEEIGTYLSQDDVQALLIDSSFEELKESKDKGK